MKQNVWTATFVTLLPELFPGPLGVSVIGRALANGLWSCNTVNMRDFAIDKHASVDDTACGGGPGMVMRPDVLDASLHAACALHHKKPKIIYMSPKGKLIDQKYVKELSQENNSVIICGRFEGVDQRILETWDVEEVSLGDFVLCGGEIAAMALVEATVRLIPGVVGAAGSLEEESFAQGLLEYPQYTRPRVWKGIAVPDVLLSGHHDKIRKWRKQKAEELTRERRPDMWVKYCDAQKIDEKG